MSCPYAHDLRHAFAKHRKPAQLDSVIPVQTGIHLLNHGLDKPSAGQSVSILGSGESRMTTRHAFAKHRKPAQLDSVIPVQTGIHLLNFGLELPI
jgi:hypothetical protein